MVGTVVMCIDHTAVMATSLFTLENQSYGKTLLVCFRDSHTVSWRKMASFPYSITQECETEKQHRVPHHYLMLTSRWEAEIRPGLLATISQLTERQHEKREESHSTSVVEDM